MKHIKRVITIFLIFLVMAASLVPSLRCSHFVYADSPTWTNCDTYYDQGQAFKAYCASRNLTIDGSILDGVTKFTTSTYQNLLNKVGLDMNAIQADIKKTVDSNGNVKYLLTASGAAAMNTIFSQFLQDNELEVGDSVNDKNIYDGKIYTDGDGNSSLVWIMPSVNQNTGSNHPIQRGSTYLYNGYDLKNMYDNGITSYTFNGLASDGLHTFTRTINYTGARDGLSEAYVNGFNPGTNGWGQYMSYVVDGDGDVIVGQNIVYYVQGSNNIYFGNYVDLRGLSSNVFTHNERWNYFGNSSYSPDNGSITNNVIVNITTNNNTINNNTYEDNDTTIINPDGGTDTPGGGNDTPTDPDDWGIDLPDLNIDWLLTGKENKFPFNIPFNIILTLSLLNAEPEAPHFEGTIDLGIYQWNYEIDLEQFDPVAEACRNFEFIAFLIGLMLLTKRLIWG